MYIHIHVHIFAYLSPHGVIQTLPSSAISCTVKNSWQKRPLPLALLLFAHNGTERWSQAINPSGFPTLTRDMNHGLFAELKVPGCAFELKAALK